MAPSPKALLLTFFLWALEQRNSSGLQPFLKESSQLGGVMCLREAQN